MAAAAESYTWNANDYANLITISSAAIASVLLVVFKSRCRDISVCWGMFSCQRVIREEADEAADDDAEPHNAEPADNP